MKKIIKQIINFLFVGGTAFIIDYVILWFLTGICQVNYLISSTISFIISLVYNYILSMIMVFEVKENSSKLKNFIIFIILSTIGLILNLIIMYIGVDILLLHYLFVKIASTAIVMVYNFISKKIVYEIMPNKNKEETI